MLMYHGSISSFIYDEGRLETFWLNLWWHSNVGHLTFGLLSVFIIMPTFSLDFSKNNLTFDHIPLYKTVETLSKI